MKRHLRQIAGELFAVLLIGGVCGAAQAGTVEGTVAFDGPPPPSNDIVFGAERQCAVMHGDNPPKIENIVVNPNGTLRDVLVRISDEVSGDYPVPEEPILIDQVGCLFIPHVAAVRAGQPVTFRNSDAVLHNIRAQAKEQRGFNIAQPVKEMTTTKTFSTQELNIPLKCDVHFWMTAYLHVLNQPFFEVTGTDGSFTIDELPPGDYTLEAVHPELGTQTRAVTVTEEAPATAAFSFSGS